MTRRRQVSQSERIFREVRSLLTGTIGRDGVIRLRQLDNDVKNLLADAKADLARRNARKAQLNAEALRQLELDLDALNQAVARLQLGL